MAVVVAAMEAWEVSWPIRIGRLTASREEPIAKTHELATGADYEKKHKEASKGRAEMLGWPPAGLCFTGDTL